MTNFVDFFFDFSLLFLQIIIISVLISKPMCWWLCDTMFLRFFFRFSFFLLARRDLTNGFLVLKCLCFAAYDYESFNCEWFGWSSLICLWATIDDFSNISAYFPCKQMTSRNFPRRFISFSNSFQRKQNSSNRTIPLNFRIRDFCWASSHMRLAISVQSIPFGWHVSN